MQFYKNTQQGFAYVFAIENTRKYSKNGKIFSLKIIR